MRNAMLSLLLLLGTIGAQSQASSPLFGVNVDLDNPAGSPSPDALVAANAGWIRFTFKDSTWSGPPSPSQLSKYIAALDGYRSRGIQALVILSYETLPGFPVLSDDEAAWADYRSRFASRAGDIASALGDRVAAYEVWNEEDEPNPRPEYAPSISPRLYGLLLQDAYGAIRARSGAKVITGGADSGNEGYLVEAGSATGGLWADGVGLHPYGQRPEPGWPSADWGFGELGEISRRYQAATGLPVWITEMGTEQQDIQAEYLTRAFRNLRDNLGDVVERALWFCWTDGMVPGFGLLDGAGNPKASYWAFHDAAAEPPPPPQPTVLRACFSSFWVPGDAAPSIRADLLVDVPPGPWTQPMGTSAASCDWYSPGESFRARFPEVGGAWRVGVDVAGSSSARDGWGVDHPWRFALLADGCGVFVPVPATTGRYTVTGFIKLAPGDDADPSHYYAGIVQEQVAWVQDGVGCP